MENLEYIGSVISTILDHECIRLKLRKEYGETNCLGLQKKGKTSYNPLRVWG